MSNLKSLLGKQILNFKLLCVGYVTVVTGLFLYSFTQVDLSLTLSRLSIWQVIQQKFQYIGYFQRPLSATLYVFIILLLYIFYLLFLRAANSRKVTKKQVWFLSFAIAGILMFSYNAFSYDLFNYIFDAKIVTYYHQNPYLHKAQDFPSDPMLSFMHWTHRIYPYGPMWLLLTVPLSFLGFQFFLPTFFLFKFLIAGSFLGTVFFISRILQKVSPQNEIFGMLFFVLNPLVIIESLVSAHNDIVMMFLAVVSIYLILDKKNLRSLIVLALSIGIKFATIFLLPIFLITYYREKIKSRMNWEVIFFLMLLCMAIAVVIASIRTNFQPWYLLYILPFASFFGQKYYIFIPSVIISLYSLFLYVPFLYFGNWNDPVPLVLSWMIMISIVLSVFLLYFGGLNSMSLVRRYKGEILVMGVIVAIFFFSRLYNILSLPIFTDEAIYVRWAQIAKNDAAWRFISLTDGKQPSFVWATMIALRFIEDPLMAGRIVSVFAGFLSLIGLFFLGKELFSNRWVGILTSIAYLLFPMALVYDRMALYDSLVGAFSVWSLYLTVLLVKKIRLDIALIVGLVIGGGVLTKTNAFFSIYLLPVSLILFDWKRKDKWARLSKWILLGLLATTLAYGMYSILRLSPFFHIIAEKNALFAYPFKEWIQHPFTFLYGNLLGEWDWLWKYMTFGGILLIALSFILDRKFVRQKILLLLWFLIPFVALAFFGRTLYPRFIFFMTLSLLPLIAYSLFKVYITVNNKILIYIVYTGLLLATLWPDYFIITNFARAPIPFADIEQYGTAWTAGKGVKEAVEFFKREAERGKIYIATQGTFGLMPFSLEIYLVNNRNVTIEGFWPIGEVIPQKVVEKNKKIPTYFVFYQPCIPCPGEGLAPISWPVNSVLQLKKGTNTYFTVYKIRPR